VRSSSCVDSSTVLRVGFLLHRRRDAFDDGPAFHGRAVQRQLAGVQARQVEQVVDDLRLAVHRAANDVHRPHQSGRRGGLRRAGGQLRVHQDQVERVLQLVRHDRQELAAHRVGRLELVRTLLLGLQQLVALLLEQLALGEVACDLGEALLTSIQDRRRRPAAEEPAAVLAHVPALVQRTAVFPGLAQLLLGLTGRPVLGHEKTCKRLAEPSPLRVAEHELGALVPAGDPPCPSSVMIA
jgi:hypothetical protein